MSVFSESMIVLGLASLGFCASAAADLQVLELRTEYRINPEGIEERQPRFNWQLQSEERNCLQHAYQILVADSPENLANDRGTLWDSGKVDSGESTFIVYAGELLQSRMRCFWKVRVWDNQNRMSAWSDTASFSLGLLCERDWHARWIGFNAIGAEDLDAAAVARIESARWIGTAPSEDENAESAKTIYFRKQFQLPEDAVIVNASLWVTAEASCQGWVNGYQLNQGRPQMKDWHEVYPHLVAALLQPGENVLAFSVTAGKAQSGLIAALKITLRDGNVIDITTDSSWLCKTEEPADSWTTGASDTEGWQPVTDIAGYNEAPWEGTAPDLTQFRPVAQLRKDFSTRAGIKEATLYATALGLYEFRINGEKAGNCFFTPGWTDYKKRLYYQRFDVTGLIRPDGENVLGALLANGWYAGHIGLKGSAAYGTKPALYAQLEIDYEDGNRQIVVTDDSWRAAFGEIRGSDLLQGEVRDFRKALSGWDMPGYDAGAWAAVSMDAPEVVPEKLQAYPGAPVKAFECLKAQSCNEPRPGVFVYDLGQNMVGWPRIELEGRSGQLIRVRHAEMLQENGTLYTDALRKAEATDFYYLSGQGREILKPSFTFHGFRYVEIRGIEQALPLEAVTGQVVNADVDIVADFRSSNPLLNQLAHNIVWGLKGNYLEAPTDCPQRDERLGWTGDAQFFMPTALYTADIGAFFTKWLVDLIQDSQQADGSFAHVAPDVIHEGGAVAWGDAALICPWLMYQFYGDVRVIEKHYDRMVLGMAFLEKTSKDFIREKLGFGDWVNLGGGAKAEVICTAYYAYLADIMSQMAALIGKEDDAAAYAELHKNIKEAFIRNFVGDDGSILESSQTGYALAFAFDLIPEKLKEAAARHYVEEIARFDWHLATGFIGTPRLLPSLTRAGRDDVAYQLLMNTTYPSWLYQVTLGATTMWERWNGWTPEKGFETPGMNSFNHYAFGAVGEWLYSRVAGIRPESPGFARMRIAPLPGGGLTEARLDYRSIRGLIHAGWEVKDGILSLDVTVPANAEALVCIPTSDPESVKEGGSTLEAAGIPVAESAADRVTCAVGSGTYHFSATVR